MKSFFFGGKSWKPFNVSYIWFGRHISLIHLYESCTSMFFKDAMTVYFVGPAAPQLNVEFRRQFQMGDSCPFMLFARKIPLILSSSWLGGGFSVVCFFHCILWEMVQFDSWFSNRCFNHQLETYWSDLVSTTQDIFPSFTRMTAYILILHVKSKGPAHPMRHFPQRRPCALGWWLPHHGFHWDGIWQVTFSSDLGQLAFWPVQGRDTKQNGF